MNTAQHKNIGIYRYDESKMEWPTQRKKYRFDGYEDKCQNKKINNETSELYFGVGVACGTEKECTRLTTHQMCIGLQRVYI